MNYVTEDNIRDILNGIQSKVSGGSGFTEWKANTSYTSGQLIIYNGQLYKVVNSFTSGATFSDTDLEKYLPQSMTAQEIQDAIAAYTPPLI